MENKFTSAIIVAAGNSSRMGKNKIFLELLNTPVIAHTLKIFEKANLINEIIVVCKKSDESSIHSIIKKYNINKFKCFATGGLSRQDSVFSGIKCSDIKTSHYVIHDAARCLITPDEINKTVLDSFSYKASSLGVPCKDTVKILDSNNFVASTPNRNSLWAIQTPQVFEKNLYLKAMNFALENQKNYTDDCQLVENIGVPVHITMGNYLNLKLTTPDDIIIFEHILNVREN